VRNTFGRAILISEYNYTYYLDGNQHTKTEAAGTTTYFYDGLNRPETAILHDGTVQNYEFDTSGNRTKIATRNLIKCTECEYQLSATAGTIFHNTKTPLLKWYLAIYLITIDKRGISALQLQKEIGITYKTAWYMNKRIREAMKIADDKYLLEDNVVIDEAYFSGVKQPQTVITSPKNVVAEQEIIK
jgi:transposase-like protein